MMGRAVVMFVLCLIACVTGGAAESDRQWTVYLTQDKHLDYNWCGSTTEIELRMATLLDYYLDAAIDERGRWNLDGTLWEEVYRRHRGPEGAARLHEAIRRGRIGYAGNYAVLLWGILDTETAIRASYGAIPIEKSTGVPARTALVMENPALTGGLANVLTACGFNFLGRGVYQLRAESYLHRREPCPLFWWQAPNGRRLLVRWDLYEDTKSWGGYAEGYSLSAMAGEKWDAFRVQSAGDRNSPEVFAKRTAFIRQTIERYEAYGARYPISSILLLGTGWDNWTQTDDLSRFVEKFNTTGDGSIRLVDARYEDFFVAAEREIREKRLSIPTLCGSFGMCWEEWAAHLAGLTAQFREAQRQLRLAEAAHALEAMAGRSNQEDRHLLDQAVTALLKFAEHDFGGTDRSRAALSAGARADAIAQAMDLARSLMPEQAGDSPSPATAFEPERTTFGWRGGRVVFDPDCCTIVSLVDAESKEWIPSDGTGGLGEFVHTRYRSYAKADAVFPRVLKEPRDVLVRNTVCRRGPHGVEIFAAFDRSGFSIASTWFFHRDQPWIDVTYRLRGGWTDVPQSAEFRFPFSIRGPTYRYDAPGAVLAAGPQNKGGDDLPGANPELFAGVTYAAASGANRTALLLTPDTFLLRFGSVDVGLQAPDTERTSAEIRSMPMMNPTGNDHQFGQGGQREWTFRYRIVLLGEAFNAIRAVQEAQKFATPPFLLAPGQTPAVPGLAALDIDFPGGPLLAFKVAEDNNRLILRFWNVSHGIVTGSLRTPAQWSRATSCDALERFQEPLSESDNGRVRFTAGPCEIVTLALSPSEGGN